MYARIQHFGSIQPPCTGDNDPLTVCLTDTMDKNFQSGSIGHLFGSRSRKCQLYMAQRCAENWDGFCEYYYRDRAGCQWPDRQQWPNTVQPRGWACQEGVAPPLTTGEQLLQNTAERKYCTYLNCEKQCEKFNPMDPSSPTITYYTDTGYGENCIPVCNVDPSTIDDDPVMDRMIANPKAAAGTLINICNTAKRQGTDISGTKLGAVCNQYFQNMQKLRSAQPL